MSQTISLSKGCLRIYYDSGKVLGSVYRASSIIGYEISSSKKYVYIYFLNHSGGYRGSIYCGDNFEQITRILDEALANAENQTRLQ